MKEFAKRLAKAGRDLRDLQADAVRVSRAIDHAEGRLWGFYQKHLRDLRKNKK